MLRKVKHQVPNSSQSQHAMTLTNNHRSPSQYAIITLGSPQEKPDSLC